MVRLNTRKKRSLVLVFLALVLCFIFCYTGYLSEKSEQNVRLFVEKLFTSDVESYLSYIDRFGETNWQNENTKIQVLTSYGLFEEFSSCCTPDAYDSLINNTACNIFTVSRYAHTYGFYSITPSDIEVSVSYEGYDMRGYLVECNMNFVKGEKTYTRPMNLEIQVKTGKDLMDYGTVYQYTCGSSLFINPPEHFLYYF